MTTAIVVIAVGLTVFVRAQSGPSEFDQRRAQADTIARDAASIERSFSGASPLGWAREHMAADRASGRLAVDRWQGDAEPDGSGPPILSLIYDEQSAHAQSHRFDDPSDNGPTWYLMENNGGMDRDVFEQFFAADWVVLDKYTDASPQLVGTEQLRGESLERFELFVPASAYGTHQGIRIGTVGLISPLNGVTYSFWFAEDGELRRMLVSADAGGTPWTYESWSHVSHEPAVIDLPDAARSWNEMIAKTDR